MEFPLDNLKIGTRIQLVKSYDNREIMYPSQILDNMDPNILVVSGPIKNNNIVFMHKGDLVKVN